MKAGRLSQPRMVDVVENTALGRSTSHSGKRLRISSERDPALEAGQRRAEAVVGADAEAEVRALFAVDVEHVAVRRELAVVAVAPRRSASS